MPPSTSPLIPFKDSLTEGVKYSVGSPYITSFEVNQDFRFFSVILHELFMQLFLGEGLGCLLRNSGPNWAVSPNFTSQCSRLSAFTSQITSRCKPNQVCAE